MSKCRRYDQGKITHNMSKFLCTSELDWVFIFVSPEAVLF